MEVSQTIENPEYQIYSRTPETYLGSLRARPNDYLEFSGGWKTKDEFAQPEPGAKLTLKFESKQVFLVMNPVAESAAVIITLDGQKTGEIIVDTDKLYLLVDLPQSGRHTLELVFPDGNIQAYAFTFG